MMSQGGESTIAIDRRGADRRRQRSRFVLRERRTGFDRRCTLAAGAVSGVVNQALVGLRDRPRVLAGLLLAVNVLNVADLALTLKVLREGGGEANPIMRSLLALGPVWGGLFKILAVLLVSLILWRCRCFRDVLKTSLAVVAIFAAVILYHIVGMLAFG